MSKVTVLFHDFLPKITPKYQNHGSKGVRTVSALRKLFDKPLTLCACWANLPRRQEPWHPWRILDERLVDLLALLAGRLGGAVPEGGADDAARVVQTHSFHGELDVNQKKNCMLIDMLCSY